MLVGQSFCAIPSEVKDILCSSTEPFASWRRVWSHTVSIAGKNYNGKENWHIENTQLVEWKWLFGESREIKSGNTGQLRRRSYGVARDQSCKEPVSPGGQWLSDKQTNLLCFGCFKIHKMIRTGHLSLSRKQNAGASHLLSFLECFLENWVRRERTGIDTVIGLDTCAGPVLVL